MFGWIKRVFRKTQKTHEDAQLPSVHMLFDTVWISDVPHCGLMEIKREDHMKALVLLYEIRIAKTRKKKHSHFLAELKALEVKE